MTTGNWGRRFIRGVISFLLGMGVLSVIFGLLWSAVFFYEYYTEGSGNTPWLMAGLFILTPTVAMLIFACFCFAMATTLNSANQHQIQWDGELAALEQIRSTLQGVITALRSSGSASQPAPQPTPIPAGSLPGPALLPAGSLPSLPPSAAIAALHNHNCVPDDTRGLLLDLVQQVRDAALMSAAQREQLAMRHWGKRKATLTESIERHILTCNWAGARTQLDELQALLPEDPEVKELGERVAGEYAARLEEDVAAARSQLKHLLEIAAWTEANELVAALENKYPEAPQIDEMRRQISHAHETADRESKERILSQLAEATDQKQWRRAISAVEEFIERYPEDRLTERLRFDLTTLQENVNTQDRKEQEQLFKELLKKQRYEEALGVAKGVIAKYPQSQAAVELTKLLPKVEDLIRQRQQMPQAVVAAAAN